MGTPIFSGYVFFYTIFFLDGCTDRSVFFKIKVSNLFLLQPIKMSDLQKVDPLRACEYFNSCFKDPSTFTVVVVGSINPSIAVPLILKYLVRLLPIYKLPGLYIYLRKRVFASFFLFKESIGILYIPISCL